MFDIKGFITHSLMAQNTPGQTAVIGELSTFSQTFASEKGYYGSTLAPDYTFTAFKSTVDDVPSVLNSQAADHVLRVAKYILDKTLTSQATPIFADQLLADLVSHFASEASGFQCGEIVNDGQFYAPEWVSWSATNANMGANHVRIWFSDASFRLQYDEYEITIVAPVANLDDFFKAGGTVEALLQQKSTQQFTDDMQVAKAGNPETIMRIQQFDYVDPQLATHKVTTDWGVLIYGAAGDNIDSIKDALVAYILSHSTKTREQWTPILPDIFKRTEFILIPRWDQYAIPNRTLQAGIHSPVSNLSESLAKAVAVIPGWPAAHINSHVAHLVHPYKSISLLAVGGPDNRDNKWELTDVFADYIAVPSTSIDFNRMTDATKNWVLLLEELLLAAEKVTQFSSVPLGMTKVVRGGILFVVKSYQNIHYLVAAQSSIDPVLPVIPA